MYKGRKATKKDIILYMIWAHGPITCEEVEKLTGFKHQTASARITELHAAGRLLVEGTKDTTSGVSAYTYIAVPAR